MHTRIRTESDSEGGSTPLIGDQHDHVPNTRIGADLLLDDAEPLTGIERYALDILAGDVKDRLKEMASSEEYVSHKDGETFVTFELDSAHG